MSTTIAATWKPAIRFKPKATGRNVSIRQRAFLIPPRGHRPCSCQHFYLTSPPFLPVQLSPSGYRARLRWPPPQRRKPHLNHGERRLAKTSAASTEVAGIRLRGRESRALAGTRLGPPHPFVSEGLDEDEPPLRGACARAAGWPNRATPLAELPKEPERSRSSQARSLR